MADTKFPGPYVNKTAKDESIMEYVPMDSMDIGARSSGMPKEVKNSNSIDHVGGSTPSPVKNKFP